MINSWFSHHDAENTSDLVCRVHQILSRDDFTNILNRLFNAFTIKKNIEIYLQDCWCQSSNHSNDRIPGNEKQGTCGIIWSNTKNDIENDQKEKEQSNQSQVSGQNGIDHFNNETVLMKVSCKKKCACCFLSLLRSRVLVPGSVFVKVFWLKTW